MSPLGQTHCISITFPALPPVSMHDVEPLEAFFFAITKQLLQISY